MALMQVSPDYLGGATGIQNILNNYYEQQIASIGNAEEQLVARKLIEEGLIVDGARVSLANAIVKNNYEISDNLLEKLLHTRLIRGENTHLGRAYEVSHDTLVEPILKSYEKRYVAEQLAAQEAQLKIEAQKRQRARKTIIGVTTLAVVAVIGMIVAVIAFVDARKATAKAKKAKKQIEETSKLNSYKTNITTAEALLLHNNHRQAFNTLITSIDTLLEQYPNIAINTGQELKMSEQYLGANFHHFNAILWQAKYHNRQLYKFHDKIYINAGLSSNSKGTITSYPAHNLSIKREGFAGFTISDLKSKKQHRINYGKFPENNLREHNFLADEETNQIVFLDSSEAVILYDVRTAKQLFRLDEDTQKEYQIYDSQIEVALDGNYVLFVSNEQFLVVDKTGKLVYRRPNERFYLEGMHFEIRNHRLFYNMDREFKIVNLQTKEEQSVLAPNNDYIEAMYSLKDQLVLITDKLEAVFLDNTGVFLKKQSLQPAVEPNWSFSQQQQQRGLSPTLEPKSYYGIGKDRSKLKRYSELTFIKKISHSTVLIGHKNDLILWNMVQNKLQWLYGGNWAGAETPSVALVDDRYTAVLRANDLMLFDGEHTILVLNDIIEGKLMKGASLSCYQNRYLIIGLPSMNQSFVVDLKMRPLEYIPNIKSYSYQKDNICAIRDQEIAVYNASDKKKLAQYPLPNDPDFVENSWKAIALPQQKILLQSCNTYQGKSILLGEKGKQLRSFQEVVVTTDKQQLVEMNGKALKWYDLNGKDLKKFSFQQEDYDYISNLMLSPYGEHALVEMTSKKQKEKGIFLLNTSTMKTTFIGDSKSSAALLFVKAKGEELLAFIGIDKGVVVADPSSQKVLGHWNGDQIHGLFWGDLINSEMNYPKQLPQGLFAFGEDINCMRWVEGKLQLEPLTPPNIDAIGKTSISPLPSIHGWLSQDGKLFSYGQKRVTLPSLSNYSYTQEHTALAQWSYGNQQYLVEFPLHPKVLIEEERKRAEELHKHLMHIL